MGTPTTSVWTAANLVTMARVALVPLVVLALLADQGTGGWRWVAVVLFTLAAATDRLDGYLARRMNQVTDWGKLVDPIADKALIGSTLVGLSVLGDLPWWVTIVILVRELGITAMRFAVLRYVVIPASRGGKLKTVLQSVAIGMFVAPLDTLWPFLTVVAWVVLLAAVALTVVTGVDYLRTGWAVRKQAP
ncbi:CDP-diacylglycerol--glycerol-3-phosphate 3-phosphatidyltransferase [Actinotalea sp.]|uniref:CDP-diacylglycerol--glycerol-3-phosphate 3-phosphatidyltransferase n=1 Tax=Actinotalea sp. TaxID=1872145 RepID=UPI002CBD2ED0|nr:CDP-diacylglycerol--glycerol-3-phosphate 3-phosphatidyltransferase [Actinotalea sp.]HQY33906.1 CDP-diacylglycerol--glycerol-3-phosphate 3-phosphatidyltransferase [Actinotalea sp.]HRA51204.1 CDP-diacylglycerol--glycerol-3-phosphate 3-phosphatidyltransferase [Actinotalea sp.]